MKWLLTTVLLIVKAIVHPATTQTATLSAR